jgi:hypothetical protein
MEVNYNRMHLYQTLSVLDITTWRQPGTWSLVLQMYTNGKQVQVSAKNYKYLEYYLLGYDAV